MTRILGIDPGLTRCGIGVVRALGGRRVEFEHVEVLQSSPDDPLQQRLNTLGSAIARILDSPDPPAAVALERVFAQQNLPSVMGVAQLSGIVMFLAAQREIPVTLYTPNEVKMQVTGYGAADKTQVATMVTRMLGLAKPPKPADAADALALALTHAYHLSWATGAVSTSAGARQNRDRFTGGLNAAAAGAGGFANPAVRSAGGSLTPAQQVWAAAEQRAGKRRKNARRSGGR